MAATRSFLVALLLLSPGLAVAQITADINVNITSGQSPLAVGFDARDTTHTDPTTQTNRFSDLIYLWDFGDSTSGTWTPTGMSRNQMSGPIAAHVYEPSAFPDCGGTCKIFTAELTVKDASGNESTANQVITVYDPSSTGANGWGDAGETVCISTNTNHTGCPAGATQRSNNVKSFQLNLSDEVAAGFRRILFHQGQTWTASGTYDLSVNGPALIGSYGTGKAIVNVTAANILGLGVRSDWRIQDLSFTGPGTIATLFYLSGGEGTDNLLVQRTTIADQAIRWIVSWPLNSLSASSDDTKAPRHTFFVDNDWGDLETTAGGYQLYVVGWGLYILGNIFGTVPLEHGIRVEQAKDVLISNNDFAQPMVKTAMNLRDVPPTCGLCPRPLCGVPTERYVIQYNDVDCSTSSCVGVGIQTCSGGGFAVEQMEARDYLFEGNFFDGSSGVTEAINIQEGCARCMIRDNIVDLTGSVFSRGLAFATSGVSANNNTCYRSDVSSAGVATCVVPSPTMVSCQNNAMYAPNWSTPSTISAVYPAPSSCTSNASNLHNGTSGGITSDPFTSSTPTARADFTPHASSQLLNVGVNSRQRDNLGLCHPGSNTDVGAIEQGAGSCFAAAEKSLDCTNTGPVTDAQTFDITIVPVNFVGTVGSYLFDCNDDGAAGGCVGESGVLGTCTGTSCTCTCDAIAAGSHVIDCSGADGTGTYTDTTTVVVTPTSVTTGSGWTGARALGVKVN